MPPIRFLLQKMLVSPRSLTHLPTSRVGLVLLTRYVKSIRLHHANLEMLIHMPPLVKNLKFVLTKNAIRAGRFWLQKTWSNWTTSRYPIRTPILILGSSYIETVGIPYLLSKRFPKLQETTWPSPGLRIFIRMPESNSAKKAFSKSLIRIFRDFSVPMGISSWWENRAKVAPGNLERKCLSISSKKKFNKMEWRNRTGGIPPFNMFFPALFSTGECRKFSIRFRMNWSSIRGLILSRSRFIQRIWL